MPPFLHPILQVGDFAADCTLPDGSHLSELCDQPVILAFAPIAWNPAHAYQSEIFARLLQEFDNRAAFVDSSTGPWHSLDSGGSLAAQFGVGGQRALVLLDGRGVVRWKIAVENGQNFRPGEILAALESLKTSTSLGTGGVLSRRSFLTATLAAAALLMLPRFGANAETIGDARIVPGKYDRSGTMPVTLKVNGQTHRLELESRVALLDAVREYLHLTGTKKGCDHGQCGACTVRIDRQSALSCLTLAVMSQGKEITTIEGIASDDTLHPLQQAFIKHDAFQCGYCTPGQIMAATALMQDKRVRSEAEIREAMSGNLCRCAAYPNIIAAIKEAQSA